MIDIDKLFSDNYSKVYQCVYRVRCNKDDAEDITQNVFITIFKNINLYDSSRPFVNWAKRIAFNAAIDFKRKQVLDDKFMFLLQCDGLYQHATEEISKKYNSLYGKYRLVYELKTISNVSVKEISNITGIPVGSVMYILTKIKNSTARV